MQIQFYKYQGTGNDFILIDNRAQKIVLNTTQIQKLCNRHFGIGADGLMLLESEVGFDFKMVYYNSDGNQSSMCGNGGRCITNFAKLLGIIKDKAQFIAIDGPHESVVDAAGIVSLKMLDVKDIENGEDFYFLNTGSPHVVKFVDQLEKFDLIHEGSLIRNSARFLPEGTNVNFVEKTDDVIFVRTYERGVEDETFSCGTGVTAAAIVCSVNGLLTSKNSAIIHTRGGKLEVSFEKVLDRNFYNIWLKGPAELVFEGAFTLDDTVNNS
jgi:diaminopimelate epimerase